MSEVWSEKKAFCLLKLPFQDLMFQAHSMHRENFTPNEIQISTLLSIKTGGCSEDCSYCRQSSRYKTEEERQALVDIDVVEQAAKRAKENGASRLCMGAAWRSPKEADLEKVCEMIRIVKRFGLEACVTLGMLKADQAKKLKEAGLDYYNHNIDTSPEYYKKIITTHTFQDRLQTLEHIRENDIKICCGGILGMGESQEDRIKMLVVLANLPKPPESVPINRLVKIPGTPLEDVEEMDSLDFVRTIALARIMMPKSFIRLSAGRESMSDELQAWCFFAGANSMFCGEKLLTTPNSLPERDAQLMERLGMAPLK